MSLQEHLFERYPEHAKLALEGEAVAKFVEWLREKRVLHCSEIMKENLIAEYFRVDISKFEIERADIERQIEKSMEVDA